MARSLSSLPKWLSGDTSNASDSSSQAWGAYDDSISFFDGFSQSTLIPPSFQTVESLRSSLNGSGGTYAGAALKTSTATPAPTLVVTSGSNLEFNLIWDSSVGGAGSSESAFMTAVEDAAQFYEKVYTTPHQVVINLHVGYGEVAGSSLPFGAIGASSSEGDYVSYATLKNALQAVNGGSSDSLISNYTNALPSSDPTGKATSSTEPGPAFFVTYAEEKALGLPIGGSGYQTAIDGWIGIAKNSRLTPMDYADDATLDKSGAMPKNGYDAVSAVAHEIAEVMGRISGLGTALQSGTGATWTALDLARFTGPGLPDLTTKAGYFSLDNGATNLGTYNSSLGDAGDWASSAYDSYGFAHAGYYSPVSATDVLENAILGYQLTPAGLSKAASPTFV